MAKQEPGTTKAQIAEVIREATGCSVIASRECYDKIVGEIVRGIIAEPRHRVRLVGLGTIIAVPVPAKQVRNPGTGEMVTAAPNVRVTLRIGSEMREALKAGLLKPEKATKKKAATPKAPRAEVANPPA